MKKTITLMSMALLCHLSAILARAGDTPIANLTGDTPLDGDTPIANLVATLIQAAVSLLP